jgi:hypothetical protein
MSHGVDLSDEVDYRALSIPRNAIRNAGLNFIDMMRDGKITTRGECYSPNFPALFSRNKLPSRI